MKLFQYLARSSNPRLGTFLTLLCTLNACGPDETVSGYADPKAVYTLQEVDGASYPASATIQFPEEGQIRGAGPCNSFSASQSAPYPWLSIGPILATRRACADLEAESTFFTALSSMTIAEVTGSTLILTNTEGGMMVFQSK